MSRLAGADPTLRAAVFTCLAAVPGGAQQTTSPDTTWIYPLEAIVVTADRSAGSLARSTASVSVVSAETLSRLPGRSIADALTSIPGFAFLHSDGLGYAPRATVRGFYGGGEAAYVLLLVDGRPVNDLETGTVNWNLIPLSAVRSIEVVRGAASSLYGDAALGGVVNVITHAGAGGGASLSLSGGSHDSFTGRGRTSGIVGDRAYAVSADLVRTGGYRAHAARAFGTVSGNVSLVERPDRSLTLSTLGHWRSYEEPGPLTGDALQRSRTESAPFYRFDETDEASVRMSLDGTLGAGEARRLSASLTGEYRSLDRVRTLPLGTDLTDTKNRVLGATRVGASVQASAASILQEGDRMTVGLEGAVKLLDTRYYRVVTGDENAYLAADGARGELDARGDGRRLEGALYLQYDWYPTPRVRVTGGGRLDLLADAFDPELPEDAEKTTADHSAFSPKLGVNVRYAGPGRHLGHVYANVSRSFKAPTPDQLFDQRTTPAPFPPFVATVSNPDLVPQHGTSVEAGLYHRTELVPDRLTLGTTVSVYQIEMEDELDFDFATFRFVNLAESRHRGVEGNLTVDLGDRAGLFLAYTLQDVTARGGQNDGNQLKAVPRDLWNAGFTLRDASGLGGGLKLTRAGGMWVDDANTVPVADYTTVAGRVSFARAGGPSVFLDVFNLLDEAYSSTAFPDPGGSDVVFFHPAAGRTFSLGVEVSSR